MNIMIVGGGLLGRKTAEMLDEAGHDVVLIDASQENLALLGKTTTTVGLADGLRRMGKNSVVALREPSLGPVFGVKGGAAGGGYAQVVPMEDINLHFTGDFHTQQQEWHLLVTIVLILIGIIQQFRN